VRAAAATIAAAVLLAAALLATETRVELQVVSERTGRVLVARPIGAAMRVELRYRHSVERTPVIEVFEVSRGGLDFVEMWFASQGAGLPTEGYTREGNMFVLRRRRRVGALPLRVSAIAGHVLWVDGRPLDLVAAAGDGAPVLVRVQHVRRLRSRSSGARR
jgi:hypothetical protein